MQRYQRARQQQPGQAVWWLREARALAALKRGGQRLMLLIQATRALSQGGAEAVPLRLALARAWIAAGRHSEARVVYQQLLEQTPGHALALQQLARLWLTQDSGKALDYARRAVQARPSADNYYTLGIVLLRAEQQAEAAKALRESLARRPGHANTAYHLALALSQAGHPGQAQAILTPLLKSASDFGMRAAAEKLLASLPAQ